MDNKFQLMQKLSAAQFAMWELHLYMDTHPEDLQALKLHNEYKEKYIKLKKCYEENYGPITAYEGQGVEWLKNPWPWDKEGCDY